MLDNDTLFEDFCRHCGSINLAEIPEAVNSKYHSRLICADCETFLKWLPKSKIFEVSVTRLLQNRNLQVWERQFLKAVVLRSPNSAEEIAIRAIEERVNALHNHQT